MIPQISVLIPTRNRSNELLSLISIIKKCNSNKIEFIISDNSDKPLKKYDQNLIKYVRPKKILNMTEHWNFLLSHASGKYITFVGDDDAFIPSELLRLVEYTNLHSVDIIWTRDAGYGWPTPKSNGNFFQIINRASTKRNLDLIRNEILDFKYKIDLPIPYNRALFSQRILKKFHMDYPGEMFCSSRIPDLSAAVKIVFLARSQAFFDRTVFISGASKTSNGLLVRNGSALDNKLGFNDTKFNPLPPGKLSKLKQAPPFGYITFYEAYLASIDQLNLKMNCSERKIAFQTVYYSSDSRKQKAISLEIWYEHRFAIYLGYWLHIAFFKFFNNAKNKFDLYVNLGIRLLFFRTSVIIINGKALKNTSSMVKFLENSDVLSINKRMTKIHTE